MGAPIKPLTIQQVTHIYPPVGPLISKLALKICSNIFYVKNIIISSGDILYSKKGLIDMCFVFIYFFFCLRFTQSFTHIPYIYIPLCVCIFMTKATWESMNVDLGGTRKKISFVRGMI